MSDGKEIREMNPCGLAAKWNITKLQWDFFILQEGVFANLLKWRRVDMHYCHS